MKTSSCVGGTAAVTQVSGGEESSGGGQALRWVVGGGAPWEGRWSSFRVNESSSSATLSLTPRWVKKAVGPMVLKLSRRGSWADRFGSHGNTDEFQNLRGCLERQRPSEKGEQSAKPKNDMQADSLGFNPGLFPISPWHSGRLPSRSQPQLLLCKEQPAASAALGL